MKKFIEYSPSSMLKGATRSALEIALADALERMYQAEMIDTEMHYLQIAESGYHYCERNGYEYNDNEYDWRSADDWKSDRLRELLPGNL